VFSGAIEAIYQELANWKEEKRTKKTNPKFTGKLQELKAERKLVRDQVKAVKVAAKEDAAIKPLIEEVNLAVDAAIKETRNHSATSMACIGLITWRMSDRPNLPGVFKVSV
jgi:hypothetical protein